MSLAKKLIDKIISTHTIKNFHFTISIQIVLAES